MKQATQTMAVLMYHSAFAIFQLMVQIFNLLAVNPSHCTALMFYLQWFEDFMADLTFGDVKPFTPAFYM